MKKADDEAADEMRKEYDFGALGPGVRGKYAHRLRGTTLVALDPEIAQAFPTSRAVNQALRSYLKARSLRGPAPVAKRAIRRSKSTKK